MSGRVQSMLEKAGECDRNAAGARVPEAQSAFKPLPSSGAALLSRSSKVNAGMANRSVCKRACAQDARHVHPPDACYFSHQSLAASEAQADVGRDLQYRYGPRWVHA